MGSVITIMLAVTIPIVMAVPMFNHYDLFGMSSAPIAVVVTVPISLDDYRSILRIRRIYGVGESDCHNSGDSNCNTAHDLSSLNSMKCCRVELIARDNVPEKVLQFGHFASVMAAFGVGADIMFGGRDVRNDLKQTSKPATRL